jgi:adenosylcobinamide-GDP ribazoletransferase
MSRTTPLEPIARLDPPDRGGQWAALIAAVQFLTRIPISTRAPAPAALRHAPRYFPLVATGIGLTTASLVLAGSLFWPIWLAVLLAMTVEFRLTGGLHEDAVADFCDAFGGGWTRERVLEIMKDSRIGTYGTLGLVSALAIRFGATLAVIEQAGIGRILVWGTAIVTAAAMGRWLIVLVMTLVPPLENRESLSREVGSRMTYADLAMASACAAPCLIVFGWLRPIPCLIAVGSLLVAAIWFRGLVLRKLDGITGDCLGFIGYLGQLIVLLAASVKGGGWGT